MGEAGVCFQMQVRKEEQERSRGTSGLARSLRLTKFKMEEKEKLEEERVRDFDHSWAFG